MEVTRNREEILAEILARDSRYPVAAYDFVSRAVQVTSQELQQQRQNHEQVRHITGQELAFGMRKLLLAQYGCMAIDVLNAWNIHETGDFGNLVYNMVDGKLLGVSREDSRADFDDLFDFYEVFVHPYGTGGRTARPLPVLS